MIGIRFRTGIHVGFCSLAMISGLNATTMVGCRLFMVNFECFHCAHFGASSSMDWPHAGGFRRRLSTVYSIQSISRLSHCTAFVFDVRFFVTVLLIRPVAYIHCMSMLNGCSDAIKGNYRKHCCGRFQWRLPSMALCIGWAHNELTTI